jgi:hypothetical protein
MRAGTAVIGFGLSLLLLGALADRVLGTPALPALAAAAPVVRLTWVDAEGVARSVHRGATAETTAMLKPAGIRVAWENSDGRARELAADEVQVVLAAAAPPSMARTTMGAARPRPVGPRSVWVFVSAVRAALGLDGDVRSLLPPADNGRLAQAVGRVILHEVVHILAPWRPHAATGLMCGRLATPTLRQPRLRLEPDLLDVIRAAAAGDAVRPRGDTMALVEYDEVMVD